MRNFIAIIAIMSSCTYEEPASHRQHVCREAARGADVACLAYEVDPDVCKDIVETTHELCMGARPNLVDKNGNYINSGLSAR